MSQTHQEVHPPDNKESSNTLSGLGSPFRPLAKELIRCGLLAYGTISSTLGSMGKQFSELVEEAKSEAGSSASTHQASRKKSEGGAAETGNDSHSRKHKKP